MIGINAQIQSQSGGGEGVGFAIPVDTVRRSLRELRDQGHVDYGYLGVESLTIWPQLAERLGLDVNTGALVQDVVDGSPAENAGIKAGDDTITFQGQTNIAVGGDLIVGVNGKPLTREHDLADEISAHSAGDRVRLTLVRDGKRRHGRGRARQAARGGSARSRCASSSATSPWRCASACCRMLGSHAGRAHEAERGGRRRDLRDRRRGRARARGVPRRARARRGLLLRGPRAGRARRRARDGAGGGPDRRHPPRAGGARVLLRVGGGRAAGAASRRWAT